MEHEAELAAMRSRIEGIEVDLGARIALLEQQIAALQGPAGAAGVSIAADRVTGSPPPLHRPANGMGADEARPTSPPSTGSTTPPPSAATPGTAALPPTLGAPPPPTPPPPTPPPPSPDQQPSGHATAPGFRSTASPPSFEVGVEVLLRWVGVGLVVLAAVFLVSTAISRGWIGPELQLLGATVGGLAMLGAAIRLVDRRRGFGLALGNGGAAVVVVCAGAAYGWLELYSAGTALVLVAAAALISVLAGLRLRMESVAVTGTGAMFIVPTVASILNDAPVLATGLWLALFAIAVTALGLNRGWVAYRIASIWTTAVWVIGLAAVLSEDGNTDHVVAGVLLVAVVGAVLWLNPLLAERWSAGEASRTATRRALAGLEHRTAVLTPVWAWGSIVLFAGMELERSGGWFGLLLAAGFAALALVAGVVERWISEVAVGSHLLGAGLLVTVAVVGWLGGPTLIVVIAGQALATLLISRYFSDGLLRLNAYLLGLMAWLMLVVSLIEAADDGGPTAGEHLAYGVVVAALAAMAWLTDRHEQRSLAEVVHGIVWLAGIGYLCSLVAPVIDDRAWLFVGVVVVGAGIAVHRRLGPYVLVLTTAVGGATLLGAAVSIIDAADSGTDATGHLANLSVVAALAAATYAAWFIIDRLDAARPLLVLTWIAVLGWLASVLLHAPQGQVAVSGAWAVAACIAVVAGVRSGETVVRVLGLGTLAIVLTKLLTVDLAEVETLWRVGLFLVIGLGLLRLGYVLPALAERYGPPDEDRGPQAPPPGQHVPTATPPPPHDPTP